MSETPALAVVIGKPKLIAQRISHAVKDHSVMFLNAAALSTGAGASAVFGFLFWWFAARSYSASTVGIAAATISMMNFLALVGELGMGALLMGELPKSPKSGPYLISAALVSTLVSMLSIGLVYTAILSWHSYDTVPAATAHGRSAFLAGVVLTGFTLVLDQALIGLFFAWLQMLRVVAFSAIKLILLVVITRRALESGGEWDIFGAWIIGQSASIALLAILCISQGRRVWFPPRVRLLRPLIRTIINHHVLNIVIQAPGLLLPVMVAAILSPSVNAAFYVAWTIASVFLLIPASLASVLLSVGASQPLELARRLQLSLFVSGSISVAAAILMYFSANFILNKFNPDYVSVAGASLQILSIGNIAVAIKYHYVTVQRLRYRMLQASVALGAGATLELLCALTGALKYGLLGLTEGWLLAVTAEAAFLSPVILRALRDQSSNGVAEVVRIADPAPTEIETTGRAVELSCEPT